MAKKKVVHGKKEGYVYVFSNPWLVDGLIKIGITEDLEKRLQDSGKNTYVPDRYVCQYAVKVDDMSYYEGWLADALEDNRINKKREFYECEASNVKTLFRPLVSLGMVKEVPKSELDRLNGVVKAVLQSSGDITKRRKNNTFKDLGIPLGAELVFSNGEDKCVIVDEVNQVNFNGGTLSISRLATNLNGYPSNGFDFFSYGGKFLSQMRR
jgi:hypothetical protein